MSYPAHLESNLGNTVSALFFSNLFTILQFALSSTASRTTSNKGFFLENTKKASFFEKRFFWFFKNQYLKSQDHRTTFFVESFEHLRLSELFSNTFGLLEVMLSWFEEDLPPLKPDVRGGFLQIKIKSLVKVQKCSKKVQMVLNVLKFPRKKLCDDPVNLRINFWKI